MSPQAATYPAGVQHKYEVQSTKYGAPDGTSLLAPGTWHLFTKYGDLQDTSPLTSHNSHLTTEKISSRNQPVHIVAKVMAGDKIDILGKSYYLNTTSITNANSTSLSVSQLMASLLLGPANPVGAKGATATDLSALNNGVIPSSFIRGNNNEPATTIPKAYINYILLDDQFKYAGGGSSRVGSSGVVKDHWTDGLQNINVTKSGYLFVYVSNESNFNVFFDNLQVVHTRGPVLEETHYYPFGLIMSGLFSKALAFGTPENKLKYNGKEEQRNEFSDGSGLEWLDYGARMYDVQIGRFFTQDRLSEKSYLINPYQYAINNPILYIDINGDSTRTYFYNEEGNIINSIPDVVSELFMSEYGIELGYNEETNMLYGSQVSEDELNSKGYTNKKSQTAIEDWMKELGDGVSKGTLVFGHNIGLIGGEKKDAPVEWGQARGDVSFIDLGDFDSEGNVKGAIFPPSLNKRTYNLARIIEHEFIGHSIRNENDNNRSDYSPGNTENSIVNIYRSQMNLTRRQSYSSAIFRGGKLTSGILFGNQRFPTQSGPISTVFVEINSKVLTDVKRAF